jgi:heme exporter protein CcmD
MSSWFDMGHYGFYVWTSYGIVVFVLAMNALSIRWKTRKIHAKLLRWLKG